MYLQSKKLIIASQPKTHSDPFPDRDGRNFCREHSLDKGILNSARPAQCNAWASQVKLPTACIKNLYLSYPLQQAFDRALTSVQTDNPDEMNEDKRSKTG